jgi:hypothetical protein
MSLASVYCDAPFIFICLFRFLFSFPYSVFLFSIKSFYTSGWLSYQIYTHFIEGKYNSNYLEAVLCSVLHIRLGVTTIYFFLLPLADSKRKIDEQMLATHIQR